jgi:signal transduction histidine kinase
MADRIHTQQPSATTQLTELTLLYQFSNTLLSTIRLNKLTHLVLTALTSGNLMPFERAMLFLRNERTDSLQGMLGVQHESSTNLEIIGGEDILSSRWDISDDVIAHQRKSEFCAQVRSIRFDMDEGCSFIKRVVIDQKLFHMENSDCLECAACSLIKQLGITAFAAVPLVSRGKSLGIIMVDNPQSNKTISDDELHFLRMFANQAGMAIENSMLYNRIEEANSNLREARERLVHGERLAAIGEMAANLAHELKNPLISIGGFAGRLAKSLSEESREHHYADTIVKEVSRLEKMLSEILAFSRKPTICYSSCDLSEILLDSFNSCATALEDHDICFSHNLKNTSWPILGDAHQLKQVFLNLILNACEAMPDGGDLTISAEKASRDKPAVTISIKDSGGGIAGDLISQIFSPFFTTKHHGTGLGLAIVNRILLNHNGSIKASNEGRGALFVVTLPLVETVDN